MAHGQVDISNLLKSPQEIVQGAMQQLSKPKRAPVIATSSDELEAFEAQAAAAPMDFFRDLEWAYNNIGNESPKMAPSGSALHMLKWGQSARSDFMKLITGYMTKKEKEKEDQQALKDDHKKQMKFIKSLKDEVEGISLDMLTQVSDSDLLAMVKARGLTLES